MKKLTAALLALIMALTLCTAAWADTPTAPSYAWFDGHTGTYTISNDADLFGFANIVNGTRDASSTPYNFKGATVKLANDIDLGGQTWTPVGTLSVQFAGTFDGQNKTIKNFVMGSLMDTDGYQYCGFFYRIGWNTGLVCDLTIQDVTATIGENGRFGTVACYADGGNDRNYTDHQIYNVHVKDVVVTTNSAASRVGGMFCRTTRSFKNCTVENLTVNAPNGAEIGGFVSFVYANNQRFQYCDVNGITVIASNCNNEDGIGGFAGVFNNSYGWTNYFEKCDVSNINMTIGGTKAWVGGFVGSPCANLIGTNCTTQGTINASGVTGGFVGGFMGNFGWKAANGGIEWIHKLNSCTADVDIVSGGAPAGGFVGSASTSNGGSKYGEFTNCTAKGDVTNANGAAGGFAGEAVSGQYKGCTATGTVEGETAGGFIGEAKDYTPRWDNVFSNKIGDANEIKLDGSKAEGAVVGSENAGGLVGKVEEKTSEDVAGSNGKLVVKDSTASKTVVGTNANASVSTGVNGSGSKVDAAGSTGNNETGTTIKGDNITIRKDDTTNSITVTAPAGAKVNGEVVEDNKEFDAATGKEIFTVTFDSNGGSAVPNQTVKSGDKATKPANPTKSGYTFTHWHVAGSADDAAFDFNTPIDGNIELTAHWTKNPTRHYVKSNATPTAPVESPKTFDAGVAVYGVVALTSALGMGYIGKKKF